MNYDIVEGPTAVEFAGPRPPWWRPFARRRWIRSVQLGRALFAADANKSGWLVVWRDL